MPGKSIKYSCLLSEVIKISALHSGERNYFGYRFSMAGAKGGNLSRCSSDQFCWFRYLAVSPAGSNILVSTN